MKVFKFRGGYNYSDTHNWKGDFVGNLSPDPIKWDEAKRKIFDGGIHNGETVKNDKPGIFLASRNEFGGSLRVQGYVIADSYKLAQKMLDEFCATYEQKRPAHQL